MDSLLNYTYTNKQQREDLILKWEEAGLLGMTGCYNKKFELALCYEKMAQHIIYKSDEKNSSKIPKEERLVNTMVFVLLYRVLKLEKNGLFYSIENLYDDFKEFIKGNLHIFDIAAYNMLDTEAEMCLIYSKVCKDRMIKKHFMFKRLLTEKTI